MFVVLLFLCHIETSKLQEYTQKFSSKFRLSLAWPSLALVLDVSLTLRGL